MRVAPPCTLAVRDAVHVLAILKGTLERAMGLIGCPTIKDSDQHCLAN